jgi:hypothetical protein
VRRNVGADTPFPPEVPHALNPPEGAIVDYWLAQAPSSDITLDVLDAAGAVVRHLTSAAGEPVPEAARPPEPNFWIAPPVALPKRAGHNRASWDLRYESPRSFSHSFEINANPGLTPPSPLGPLVPPGTYTLKLTVDGKSYAQTVSVKTDPRSPATLEAIRAQHALQMKIVAGIDAAYEGSRLAEALRDAVRGADPGSSLVMQLDSLAGANAGRGRGRFGPQGPPNFRGINSALVAQLNEQEQGDRAPTAAALAAFTTVCQDLTKAAAAWDRLSTKELAVLNTAITARRGSPVALPAGRIEVPSCT